MVARISLKERIPQGKHGKYDRFMARVTGDERMECGGHDP
jgi:hypothetical protein